MTRVRTQHSAQTPGHRDEAQGSCLGVRGERVGHHGPHIPKYAAHTGALVLKVYLARKLSRERSISQAGTEHCSSYEVNGAAMHSCHWNLAVVFVGAALRTGIKMNSQNQISLPHCWDKSQC